MKNAVFLVAGAAFVLFGSISTLAAPRGSEKRRHNAVITGFFSLLIVALNVPDRPIGLNIAISVPLLVAMGWLLFLMFRNR